MTWTAYRQAATSGDLLASFDAMVAIGMRPVPIGEHHITGKIKIPIGDGWGNKPIAERREQLKAFIEQGVPIGVGCQADGHIVLDIDPPGKDRSNLLAAWKETASLLFGCEDWPNTTIISTEAGCHVWFKTRPDIAELWKDRGKLEMKLPSGGKVEFFTGNDKQIQVACPPSEGKEFKTRIDPIDIPESAADVILDLLKPQVAANSVPVTTKPTTPATPFAVQWFNQKLHDLAGTVMNATEGNRHDTYRKSVRTMAGYAAGMNLETMYPMVWVMLSSAHREAKPEVSDYVLDATFRWAWKRGIDMPLTDAMVAHLSQVEPEPTSELNEEIEAADIDTILGLMKEREWLWGDKETNVGWFVQRGLHLVEGKEGTGKTRWLLDICRRWVLDMMWPDGSPIHMDVDSKMLFVASDSHFDQIAMTAQAFGIPSKSIIFTGPKADPYNFTSLDDPNTLNLVRHWCTKYKVGMVVIDTLMAASSRPLVDPQEVAKIAGPLRDLARELNVAIVLVGHLNANGETWGRAMGRQCDNVIRMEADEHDEQKITIKSVKARWNRFALPVIEGRQSETGWEYTSINSDAGDTQAMGKRERAEIAIRGMLAKVGRSSWGDIQTELQDYGHKQGTINLALKFMESTGELIGIKETFPSGKAMTFYDFNPNFNPLQ